MPSYIILMNYTKQGIKNVKDSLRLIEASTEEWETLGGKMVHFYSVLGEFDMIAIGEAPNDEVAGTFALKLSLLGDVRTQTLKAYMVKSSQKDDPSMPTFMLFMKFTDVGVRRIKGSPGRIEEAIAGWEALGGKLIGLYTVLGEYDLVAIGDAPSGDTVVQFILKLSSLGNVRTKTIRVFTKEEFAEMVRKLP